MHYSSPSACYMFHLFRIFHLLCPPWHDRPNGSRYAVEDVSFNDRNIRIVRNLANSWSLPQMTMAQGGQARPAEGHHARGLTRSDNIISSAFLSRLARRRRHCIAQINTAQQHNIALVVLNRATHYRLVAYTINCRTQCRTGRTTPPNWKHNVSRGTSIKIILTDRKHLLQLIFHCRSTPEIQVLEHKSL